MRIVWTIRGRKRFTAISDYIATEFYSEYADAWEEDVAATVERASCRQPQDRHSGIPRPQTARTS